MESQELFNLNLNVLSYVYTEHQDEVISIKYTSGSLSTYKCSTEFNTKISNYNIKIDRGRFPEDE